MKTRIGAATALTTVLACVGGGAVASAASVPVEVRIEGAKQTLVEGPLRVSAQQVDGGDGTGVHPCDGTNGGTHTTPGPTVTGAIATALDRAGYIFDARYYASFGDFLINRMGPDTGSASRSWTLAANFKALSVGGCQSKLRPGEQVIAAFGSIKTQKHFLELTGPRSVRVRRPFRVRVVDGATRRPISGARVAGVRTNGGGFARLVARYPLITALKATRADSVRSNALVVAVRPAR